MNLLPGLPTGSAVGLAIICLATLVPIQAVSGAGESDFLDELFGDSSESDDDTDRPEREAQQRQDDTVERDAIVPLEAQDDATAIAPARRSSRFIEEIVVTAQKREEDLRDVPLSVQAFSGDLLDAQGITDQNDLTRVTPGLQVATQVAFTTVFMRGIGSDAFLTADPSVATYIDGIYFPSATGLAQEFGAVDRVEVLKGPQGTLFGRNATGGAINVITKAPDFDASSVSAQVSWAEYPDFQSRMHVNIPLTDSLAANVTALYNETDHFVDALAAGEPLSRDRTRAARARVRWAPADWMDLTVSGFLYRARTPSTTFTPHQETTPLARLLLGGPGQPPRRAELDTPNFNNLDNEVLYGQLDLRPGPVDIKLLGSYQDLRLNAWFDFDGTMMPLVSFQPPNNFSVSRTAELQILSNDTTWGSQRFKWILGGYWFSGTAGFDPTIGHIGALNPELIVSGLGLPPALEDTLGTVAGLLNPLDSQGLVRTYLQGTIISDSLSGFAEGTLTLTDWLDLTLGARYQVERRRVGKSTVGISLPGMDPLAGERLELIDWQFAQDSDGNPADLSDRTTAFSPKAVLTFRPWRDELMVYLSAQRASKSSTYNAIAILTRPTLVRPEDITAYEIGLKTPLFGGVSQFSAAAFWYDITDLQVQYFALLNGGLVTFENVPESRSRGFEVELITSLFPDRVDGLVLSTGGAYVDARYIDFPNGSGFTEPSYIFQSGLDLSGNRMVRAPKVTANASLSKTWFMRGGPLELAGDIYYNSGFFLEGTNVPRSEQRDYIDVGARISYMHERSGLRLTLFGRNLTDELYVTGGLPNDFGNALFFAPPRSFGLRVGIDL